MCVQKIDEWHHIRSLMELERSSFLEPTILNFELFVSYYLSHISYLSHNFDRTSAFSIIWLLIAALESHLRTLQLVSIILKRINAVFIGEIIENWPNLTNFAHFLLKNGGKSSSNSFQISCIQFRDKTTTWELIRTINTSFPADKKILQGDLFS